MKTKTYAYPTIKILFLLGFIFFAFLAQAAQMTSSSFIIQDPIVGTGGGYGSSATFQAFSAGNTLLSGVGSSATYITQYGFLYFPNPATAQSITFDIDTAADFSNSESSTPYSVPLGTLATGSIKRSDSSSVRMIVVEAESSHGRVVTVQNANGSNGLVSTSAPADNINSCLLYTSPSPRD